MNTTFRYLRYIVLGAAAAALLGIGLGVGTTASAAEMTLKASHQWPKGDLRDHMVRIIADEVGKADVGLTIRVYPGASLFKPKQQWDAMVRGQLDISAFPLAYAGGRHPEFNMTLMPGLVKNHEHARRLDNSPFMRRIKQIMRKAGVIVLADTWLAGGFVSKGKCIRGPDTVKGLRMRAAGKAFEEMLEAAGASITSMSSSEMYTAFQTGVLDAGNTSSASLVSYRLYEQVKCLTAPGEHALWFMYEPILMSKKTWDKLTPAQKDALMAASGDAEAYAFKAGKAMDAKMVEVFKKHGVKVTTMTADEVKAWRNVARDSSYKEIVKNVQDGKRLLNMALSVQ